MAGRGGHCIFHPQFPVLYVNNELDSTVTVYRWDRDIGAIAPAQIVPTAPAGFAVRNTTAEIAVSELEMCRAPRFWWLAITNIALPPIPT